MEEYDLLVLGSGTGGKIVAGTFAQKGQRVIAVERKYVAGSCPNIACLPSKNIIHSARLRRSFIAAMNSASAKRMCASTWQPCVSASARW